MPKSYSQENVRVHLELLNKLGAKELLAYLRIKLVASRTGGFLNNHLISLAAGGYKYNPSEDTWQEQISTFHDLWKKSKSDKAARREYRAMVRNFRSQKFLAGSESTKKLKKYLYDNGLLIKSDRPDLGDSYIVSEDDIRLLDSNDQTYVSISALNVKLSCPNGKRIYGNALFTEIKNIAAMRGIAIASKSGSKVDRHGVRQRPNKSFGLKCDIKMGITSKESGLSLRGTISSLGGTANLVKSSKSTVARHRRLQKITEYSKSRVIDLKPGMNHVNILGYYLDIEVPHDRLTAFDLMDELNRSGDLKGLGKVIPWNNGIAIQESMYVVENKLDFKKGRNFYRQLAKGSTCA